MRLSSLVPIFALSTIEVAALERRTIINVGPLGVCPAVSTVSIILQPVYCTVQGTTNSNSGPVASGSLAGSSSVSLCPLTTLTTTFYSASTTTFAALKTTAVATAPVSSTKNLFIGQGLPPGTITDLGAEFLFLAFIASPNASPIKAKRAVDARQAAAASALALVDLVAPAGVPGGLSQDDCDSSSPLLLQGGQLLQFGNAVDKYSQQTDALFGFLLDPPGDQINVTFTLTDGVLTWTAPDTGVADFYYCNGVVYAGFDSPLEECVRVAVGAIAGTACVDRVRSTRTPSLTFTAPLSTSTASPTTITAQKSSTMISSPSSLSMPSSIEARGTPPASPSTTYSPILSTTVRGSKATSLPTTQSVTSSLSSTVSFSTPLNTQTSSSSSSILDSSANDTGSSTGSSTIQFTSTSLAPFSSTLTIITSSSVTMSQQSTTTTTTTTTTSTTTTTTSTSPPIAARLSLASFSDTSCTNSNSANFIATENQCLTTNVPGSTIRSVIYGLLEADPGACYTLGFYADGSCTEAFRYFSFNPRQNQGTCQGFPSMGLQSVLLKRC